MRWAVFILLFLATITPALAITMSPCPSTATTNQAFSVGVSETGATQVRLNYQGSWHTKTGSSGTWNITETTTGFKTYWGDAYVGGVWTSTGSDICYVEVTEASDTPGSVSLTLSPSTIEYGESTYISISYGDDDGTSQINVYDNDNPIGSKTCSGTSCTYSFSYNPTATGSRAIKAMGRDANTNPTEQTKTLTVTGATVPSVTSYQANPNPVGIGETVTFSVTATDAGGDLSSIKMYYGDGQTETKSCTSATCTRTFTHSYTASGTKTTYAEATDGEHTGTSANIYVGVNAPSDSDGDGVPDDDDQCSGTTPGASVVTASSSTMIGCSCAQIINFVPDPTRDDNACTDDSCSIVSGSFVAEHTPMTDGSQPEGYTDGCQGDDMIDFFCDGGQVANTTTHNHPECLNCVAQSYKACWNGDAYWYDSCDHRESTPIDDCGPGEECVDDYPEAWCEIMTCTPICNYPEQNCGSDDSCNGFCDIEEGCTPTGRTCEPDGTTYSCQCPAGTTWNGQSCENNCVTCTTNTCSDDTFTQCIDGCAYPQTCSDGCSVHGCCTYEYYIDRDNDGYGDASQNLCTEKDTQTTVSQMPTDCNDDNQKIHPGMPEDCDNGVDDDCDGLIDGADENCQYIMCAGVNCTGEEETEQVYVRVDDSCVEQLFSVKTVWSNPYCDDACAYYDEDTIETAFNSFRNVADGTACNSAGLCKAGVCLEECNYNNPPACQATAPEHSVNLNFACPLSSSGESQNCYGCKDGYYWGGNSCEEETHKITNVVDMQVVSNTAFILNPVTTDFDGNPVSNINYEYRSTIVSTSTTDPLTVKSNKVGTYAVTISAYTVGSNNKLASKTIEVALLCQANRQCCPEGSVNYAGAGTACTKNGFPGTCDQYGACAQACTNQEAENTAAKCRDGRDNDCDGAYDCVMINNEEETGCEDYCAVFCEEGQVACDDSCHSLTSSHDNCGACGNACESDELCEDGQCVRYLDCYVACDGDDDCAEGICIHPGQCDAYCDNVPTIELTEEEQTNLLTSVIKQKTYVITKTILDDQLILDITNLVGVPLNNFSLTISIPKKIAASATEIGSDYPFDIVLDDPVIRAEFAEIKGTKTITYYFPKNIDPELEENIVVAAKHGLVTLSKEYTLTQDDLSITRAFREDADGTTVTLRLTPGKTLSGVRIPLEIPKCLAGSVSEMNLKQDNYVIVNDDPLMVWTFNTLAAEEEIEFSIPRIVDDACKKQLKAFGLAEGKRTPISPWLPLAIIPIIGVILIFFQRFHGAGAEHHLSKKEFFDLARQNGQEEHEIERAWYEYKRRF